MPFAPPAIERLALSPVTPAHLPVCCPFAFWNDRGLGAEMKKPPEGGLLCLDELMVAGADPGISTISGPKWSCE
jgi:hypothetical protein